MEYSWEVRFDVALLDADLSDIAGKDLAEVIRTLPELHSVKLMLLRSMGSPEKPAELSKMGFDAWISKPISTSKLRTVLLHVAAEPVGIGSRPLGGDARVRRAKSPAGVFAAHSLRILLAEDNLVNQKVAKLLLRKLGCRIEVVNNGMDAVDAVVKRSYDLVFMDCQMPEMNGLDATKAIRKLKSAEHRSVPIIAMTANAMEEDRGLCLEAGMDDYLAKPVSTEEIRNVIEKWAIPRKQSVPQQEESMDEENKSGVLDPEVIASLKELGGEDDPTMFADLVDLFLVDTPCRIESLSTALESQDAKALEEAAHALKSSCGNLGAIGLSSLLKEIEEKGREADLEGASSLVSRSVEEFKRVEQALKSEVG